MRKYRGRIIPENYTELCEMWEKYYRENGKYPNSLICNEDKNLPSWSRVKDICSKRFNEFCEKYSIGKPSVEKYEYYCGLIEVFAKELGRTPTIREIRESNRGIPEYRWLIANCPDKNIKNYNDFVSYLNLKPKYFVTKEMATKLVLEKIRKNNGKVKAEDFDNPTQNEIGHGTIKRLWGSFNSMLIDLNIPVNQVGMSTLSKPLSQMEDDIKKLCEHLYNKNGHKHIALSDISDCEWCSNHGTYNRIFLKEYKMTIGEYIENLGYIPNGAGMGMVYKFEDGEITTSKYEYNFSNLLRRNNIEYRRNVKYNEFIIGYDGNKDCDYLIECNNVKYYIEIAGMLRDSKSIEHTKKLKLHYIQQKYLSDLIEKENMLKQAKQNYYILFPHQINDVDFLFEFINNLELAS